MSSASTRFPFLPKFRRTKFNYDQLDISAHENVVVKSKNDITSVWNLFRSSCDKAVDICRGSGNVNELRRLVRRSQLLGTWNNSGSSSGDLPIHEAAYSGYLDIVKYLVEEVGVDINATTSGGHTPLCLSCIGGHVEVLKYLIDANADIFLATQDGACGLHWASYCGRLDCVRTLLDVSSIRKSAPSLRTTTASGFTPLMLATCGGHEEVVRMMVSECGADVNFRNEEGDTALHYACFEGKQHVARLLLEDFKADDSLKDKAGYTALHLAAACGHVSTIRLLLDKSTRTDREMLMCCSVVTSGPSSHSESSRSGISLLSRDSTGCTPLHLACQGGHVEAARLLVGLRGVSDKCNGRGRGSRGRGEGGEYDTYGEDCEAKRSETLYPTALSTTLATDKEGNNCLHTAVTNNKVRVANMLLSECKLDVNCRNNYTPLLIAAWKGYLELATRLIEVHGADKFACNSRGEYALHLACLGGHERLVQYLVRCDMDCHKLTQYGKSPFYLACQYGHTAVVQYMLQCGDGINRESTDHAEGRTPLMVAAAYGQLHLVKFLVEKVMSHLRATDQRGRTCLHWACLNGHTNIVMYLIDASIRHKSTTAFLWHRDKEGHLAADLSKNPDLDFYLTQQAIAFPSEESMTENQLHILSLGHLTDY